MKPKISEFAMVAALAVAMLSGLGCSNVPSVPETLVAEDAAPLAEPAVKYRMGFLPLVADESFEKYVEETNASSEEFRYVYMPSPETRREFVEQVVAALGTLNACEDVRFLPAAEGRDLPQILDDAWEDGLDVVARPVLRRRDCVYVDGNGNWLPSFLMWLIILPISNWGIADATFAAEFEIALEFYSTAGRSADPVAVRQIQARIQHDLDDIQQGLNIFNLFITPGGMSDSQWEDVGNTLLPHLRHAGQTAILAAGTDPTGGFAADLRGAQRQLEKTLGIVIGTNPPGAARRFAVQDAEIVANILAAESGKGALVPSWAMRVLTGAGATRAAIRQAMAELFAARLRTGDRAVIFLAGVGRVDEAGGDGTFWPAGFDAEAADRTGIKISELAADLRGLPGTVAIVDAVTWLDGDRVDVGALAPLAKLSNVVVLSATGGRGMVMELDEIPGSLFATQLARVLQAAEKTDAGNDGWLNWREIAARITPTLREISTLEGAAFAPELAGTANLADGAFFRYR